jgi:hypothetical protein
MGILVVPYMTKQMQRWSVSKRQDVILRRAVTYQERYKGMTTFWEGTPMGVVLSELVCPHMHKTKAAAERCKVRPNTHLKDA